MGDATRQRAVKSDFPEVNFYDQDLVNLYERSWSWIRDQWRKGTSANGFAARYFCHPAADRINQFEACFSTFFLVYSNRIFPVTAQLDTFYEKQEEDGAIRAEYLVEDGSPVLPRSNPTGAAPPLFSWAEFNLYHKLGAKKRLREVLPTLERHFEWLETTHRKENGLYSVPVAATMMGNSPRDGCYYPLDFNAQQALNALYLSAIGDVLNDKDTSFKYKRAYFALKTRISQMMWDDETGFYYDLDRHLQRLSVRTIGAFWTLLAEIPNEDKSERLIANLSDVNEFGVEHPFPTLSAAHEAYSQDGAGYKGSVVPPFNYMIIKGLEKYGKYDMAREFTLRHLYYMLDGLYPEEGATGSLYEAYAPQREGPAKWNGKRGFPRQLLMAYNALSTVTLMIENVVGLFISLPRKTVDWRIPVMEIMGIENLLLKRNLISILSAKSTRGWEVRLESEKLYYLTINVLREERRKTLPIPSGKCSILVDKI
jgi:neutral trehalase